MRTIESSNNQGIVICEPDEIIKLDYVALKSAAKILRAINNAVRQEIINLIAENGGITVADIYGKLHLEQSVASQHLAILRSANIVAAERDGKFVHYKLNYPAIEAESKFVDALMATENAHNITKANGSSLLEGKSTPLLKAEKEINSLRNLEKDWDGEDGEVINTFQIEKALSFVNEQYTLNSVIPYFIAPTVNSGVLIVFSNKSSRMDVRFEEKEPTVVLFDNGQLKYKGAVNQEIINRIK